MPTTHESSAHEPSAHQPPASAGGPADRPPGRTGTAPGRALDAVAELRGLPFGRLHLLLVAAVFVANLFDGYDTLNPSYVISYTAGPWHLSHSAAGFMVSSGLIGFMIGALVHGPLADRLGRRPVLLTALTGAGLFSLLTAVLADTYASFVVLRLLTGVFLGVIMPLGTAYIREFTPAKDTARAVTAAVTGYCLGGVLSAFAGIYVTPDHGWSSLYWIGAISLPVGLLLIPVLPESVQYLVLAGRDRDVARTLGRLCPPRAAQYGSAEFEHPRPRAATGEIVGRLLSPRLRRTSITLWVGAFMTLFCIYGLSGWLPEVMQARGNGFAASFACVAILQFAGCIGGLVVAYVTDRRSAATGTPRGVAVLMAIATVSIVLVGIGTGKTADLVLIGFAGFGIIGSQNALVVLSADAYPTHMRSTGTGTMFGVGRIGAILGPYLIGWLLDWGDGSTGFVFTAIAIATAGGVIAGTVLALDRRRTARTERAEAVPEAL